MDIIQEIFRAILEGDYRVTEEKVRAALDAGLNPKKILDEGLIAAMTKVGVLFETGEYFVPEMLVAARAMQRGLDVLKPHLQENEVHAAGIVAIGAVRGDLHDIGKNLVGMMLEGAGFEVRDLGTDVPLERFVAAADEADIIAMSALLTTTMPNMKTVIDALETAGKRDKVKVIVGGAPITESYAREIGADGYAADASRAVAVTKLLAGKAVKPLQESL
jgi:5-methyltetrahydrofolate--homocysteine methyltransferase